MDYNPCGHKESDTTELITLSYLPTHVHTPTHLSTSSHTRTHTHTHAQGRTHILHIRFTQDSCLLDSTVVAGTHTTQLKILQKMDMMDYQ